MPVRDGLRVMIPCRLGYSGKAPRTNGTTERCLHPKCWLQGMNLPLEELFMISLLSGPAPALARPVPYICYDPAGHPEMPEYDPVR